jgi:hypothetical protein
VRRVEAVVSNALDQLDGAANAVAAMPAGEGFMLKVFVDEIRALATEVRAHALIEGDPGEEAAQPPARGARLDQVGGA